MKLSQKEVLLTQERLREVLSYNKETGDFVRLIAKSRRDKVGQIAGCLNDKGYIQIGIDGKVYQAHRLAWLYVFGYFHQEEDNSFIDHINGKRNDNRIENLKISSHAANQRNVQLSHRNTSGHIGVNRRGFFNGTKTKINYYWIAHWYDENGKRQSKNFPIHKLGEEQAKQMATVHREKQIRLLELNYNIIYSPRHGT